MPQITAINNDDDLDAALARVGPLLRAAEGTPESAELDALSKLIQEYEAIHYPMGEPTPAGRVQGRMDALGLTEEDLVPVLGSRETVDAVLAGQQEVTPAMAAALYELLTIDVRDLLPQAAGVANP